MWGRAKTTRWTVRAGTLGTGPMVRLGVRVRVVPMGLRTVVLTAARTVRPLLVAGVATRAEIRRSPLCLPRQASATARLTAALPPTLLAARAVATLHSTPQAVRTERLTTLRSAL